MDKKIKILIVEHDESDLELLQHELNKGVINYVSEVVQTEKDFEHALTTFLPDIILSDYSLPSFSGVGAFNLKQKITPAIPFILVSSVIGEENAVNLIKSGVTDYIQKDKLFSLMPKINRALEDSKILKEKNSADEKIKIQHKKLVKSEAQIRNFAKHLNQVIEDERANIAREIHDELGQQLAGIKFGLSFLKDGSNINHETEEKINVMMGEIDETIQSLRKIATKLRPGILDSLGLIPSIHWLAGEFEKKTSIKCLVLTNAKDERFEKSISICFFRICQEALTNISKHAGANEVVIQIKQNESSLLFNIADNGKGMDCEKLENPFSMGLLGMRERANIIGADLHIISKIGNGTTIQLKVNIA